MTMDMLPTYAELAGATAPDDLDGTTLAPLLLEGKPLPKRDLFWRAGRDYAVRRGPWKLVGEGSNVQLFNLDEDIGERQDVSAQHSALVKDLLASLKEWEHDVDKP